MSINPNKSHFRKEANYIRGTLHSHACTHRGSNNSPHQDLPHVRSGQAHQHLQLANKGSVDLSGVCIVVVVQSSSGVDVIKRRHLVTELIIITSSPVTTHCSQ